MVLKNRVSCTYFSRRNSEQGAHTGSPLLLEQSESVAASPALPG
jgi:hypothetical protein